MLIMSFQHLKKYIPHKLLLIFIIQYKSSQPKTSQLQFTQENKKMPKSTTLLTLIKYHNTRIFNHSLSFENNGSYSHFSINQPYTTIKYPNILFLKSFKCLQIKALPAVQRFSKGSLYYRIDLNLRQSMDLIQCDFMRHNFMYKDARNNRQLVVSAKNANKGLDFQINDDGRLYDFMLQWSQFTLVKTTLFKAIPHVYGLQTYFDESLKIMMNRFIQGNIQEQDDDKYPECINEQDDEQDMFIL